MSEETKTVLDSLSVADRIADGFDEMLYWVSATSSTFDLPRFRSSLPKAVSDLDDSSVLVSSEDENGGRYHVFFAWVISGDTFKFNIEYHNGARKRAVDEREPYAEDFMRWLGQFFSDKRVKCHMHTRFEFPLSKRQSIFPLTLTTELPDGVELYGVAMRLPSSPSGAASVKITRGRSNWYTEVVSDRHISFDEFSLDDDALESLTVLSTFLREASL